MREPQRIDLDIPDWVNDAGYRYRSRRAFDAAQAQIHAERAAVSPKFPRPPYAPPGRGGQGSAVAVVVITTALALATIMALSVYLLVS